MQLHFALPAGFWQDMRLYYDGKGDLRIMFGEYGGDWWHPEGSSIKMQTAKLEVRQEGDSWTVIVHDKVQLNYKDALHADKNWIPWNGTNMIT
jgi:hypothetical protein